MCLSVWLDNNFWTKWPLTCFFILTLSRSSYGSKFKVTLIDSFQINLYLCYISASVSCTGCEALLWITVNTLYTDKVYVTSVLIWCDTVGLVTGRALAILNLLIYPKGIIWEPVPIREVVVIVMVVGSMETVQVTPLRRFIASSP